MIQLYGINADEGDLIEALELIAGRAMGASNMFFFLAFYNMLYITVGASIFRDI